MPRKKQRKKKQSEKVGIEAIVEPRVGALYVMRARIARNWEVNNK